MRLKEIKQGMIINCKTELEAKELLGYLHEKGYKWAVGSSLEEKTEWGIYKELTCYVIKWDKKIKFSRQNLHENEYIRYTDLILPELTAKETLETIKEICYGRACNNMCPLYSDGLCMFRDTNFNENHIIETCAQWKADHEKKDFEFEWVDICRIIKVHPDGRKECVYEEDVTERELPFGASPEPECEKVLKKYIADHEGEYFAVVSHAYRVKK